jgi:hypothetical protein
MEPGAVVMPMGHLGTDAAPPRIMLRRRMDGAGSTVGRSSLQHNRDPAAMPIRSAETASDLAQIVGDEDEAEA